MKHWGLSKILFCSRLIPMWQSSLQQ